MPSLMTAVKATSTLCILWSAYMLARTRLFTKRDSDIDNGIDRKKAKYEHNPESEIVGSQIDNHSLSSLSFLKDSILIRNGVNIFYGLVYGKKNNDTNANYDSSTNLNKMNTEYSKNGLTTEESCSDELDFFYQMVCSLCVKAGLVSDTTCSPGKRRSRLLSLSKYPKVTTDYLLQLLVSYSKDLKFLDLFYENEHFDKLIDWLTVISLTALTKSSDDSLIETHSNPPSVNQLLFDGGQLTANRSCNPDNLRPESSAPEVVNGGGGGVPTAHPEYPVHLLVANFLANISQHPFSYRLRNHENVNKLLSLWEISPSLHLNLLGAKIDHNIKVHSKLADISCSTSPTPAAAPPSTTTTTAASHCKSGGECSQTKDYDSLKSFPIYCPDIYKLNISKDINENYDFDIVFVNGMLGSVFYTWRQHDSMLTTDATQYTKCWPRDWLSRQFPRARIIGVDTSLKPFIWHSICPLQKMRRTLDKRAVDIMEQLKKAEVGCRPIVWITHSAGGILVKEMLRLAKSVNTTDPSEGYVDEQPHLNASSTAENFTHTSKTYGDLSQLDEKNHPIPVQSNNPTSLHPSTSPSCKWYCHENEINDEVASMSKLYNSDDISAADEENKMHQNVSPDLSTGNQLSISPNCDRTLYEDYSDTSLMNLSDDSHLAPAEYQNLASSTQAIVFMSTPHRGNQSLFTLYRRPFRWALTPEAIQLERNSNYMLDLHVWFNMWAYRQSVRVLSMAESRVTPVNRFWSVLLVPEDIRDRDMGELVRIDSDHLYISKPMYPNDLSYTCIVRFIENLPLLNHQSAS
ncbi:unnamed protein product [Trichobilharzia szidati]|nr:unnamed protein product [Trichobilharzia szidati]